ncbi:amino acid permease-domain-containing protein [Suillus variegatus]|nr:amino acid permease-domain-containing protein [Suillus variegatus]
MVVNDYYNDLPDADSCGFIIMIQSCQRIPVLSAHRNNQSLVSDKYSPRLQSSPLGYKVTLLSSVMLNIGQILGAGIYSVPGVIMNSVGSVGLLFVFWLLAPLFALGGLMIYGEFASMFPKRSGAEVVFSATNSIVFAQYALTAFDVPITPGRQSIIAIAVCAVGMSFVALSTKWSLRAVNILTGLKVLSLVFLVFTGALVLGGFTHISDPYANFRSPSFNVIGEVHTRDPVRTVRKAGLLSLLLVTCLFFFVNVAYVAAVPKDEIKNSGQLIAALFFQRVYGESFAAQTMPIMVALSCFGNIIAVTVGQARVLREIARQGLLPYPRFFASTKPFGTPLGPVCLKYFLTVFVIVALPARDAFNFLLDLSSYPNLVFNAATAIGLWLLRRRQALAGLAPSKYRAGNIYVSLYLLSAVFLLIMPWIPPEPGHSDVSFWYATYCVVGLGVLAVCGFYYWLWIIVLPWLGGYTIVEEVERLEDGALTTRLTRKYHPSVETVDNGEQQPLIAST